MEDNQSKTPMPPFKIGKSDMKMAAKAVKKMSKSDKMKKIQEAEDLAKK